MYITPAIDSLSFYDSAVGVFHPNRNKKAGKKEDSGKN
jgi:hypothetical protein